MPSRSGSPKESHAPSVFAREIEGFTAKSKLSRRESDIVVALVRNITNSEEIAKSLGISTHTVNNHLKSIFEKTSTKSKTEVLSTFLRFAADRLQSRSMFVKRPRILVIDDEQMVAEAVASGLAERGMRTFTLTDPLRAVELISRHNIDFVICDIRMPGMNGMDVLKTVRKSFQCWPYFLFISGYPDFSVEEAMHAGAAGFLAKPLDTEQLFRAIMGHLAESGDDRVAMLQAKPAEPVVLDETYRVGDDDVGFGGVFVPLETGILKKARVGVGSVVELTLSTTQPPETLRVRGQIVWKRVSKDQGLKAGVGVRFVNMSDKDQSIFDSYLQGRNVTSFIPIGGEPGGRMASGG